MAVGAFAKPATLSREQAQSFVPPQQQQPALPVEQIAQSARQFQKRRSGVKDVLDQAMTDLASSQNLAVNQQAFASLTDGIRNRISEITESGDLIDRREEVKKLAREVKRVKGTFDQNRSNLEDSLKNLQEQDKLSPAQRKAQRERLIEQAQLQVGPDGTPKGGLSAPKTYGDVTTPYEVIDDMDFNDLIKTVRTKRGPAQQSGVSAKRVQQEALRRLGMLDKNAPVAPGLKNWKRYETQAIARQLRQENPDMDDEEFRKKLQGRLRSKMKQTVKSAINTKTRQSSRDLIETEGDDGEREQFGDVSLPEGVYTFNANPQGSTLGNIEASTVSEARKKEARAASQARKEQLKKNFKTRFGLSFEKFKDIEEMRKEPPQGDTAPGPMTPSDLTAGQTLEKKVKQRYNDGLWGPYQMAKQAWEDTEKVATNHQYLSIRGSEKLNEMERLLDQTFGINPESLDVPAAQITEDHPGGWGTAEIKAHLADNYKFKGLGRNGQQLLLEYTGDDTDIPGVEPGGAFTVEAPDRVRQAIFKDSHDDLFGDRVSKLVRGNNAVSDIAVGNDWTEAQYRGKTFDLSLSLRSNNELPGAEEMKTVYTVRTDDSEGPVSYGQVVDRIIKTGNEEWLKTIRTKAKHDGTTNVDPGLINAAIKKGGVDELSERYQKQLADPVTYDQKFPAIEFGAGFSQQ